MQAYLHEWTDKVATDCIHVLLDKMGIIFEVINEFEEQETSLHPQACTSSAQYMALHPVTLNQKALPRM